jgi:hypothetical protein
MPNPGASVRIRADIFFIAFIMNIVYIPYTPARVSIFYRIASIMLRGYGTSVRIQAYNYIVLFVP